MKLLAYVRSVAAKFSHRSQIADEMDEELRAHIQLRADDLERSGVDRAEAERQARIEFGGQERFKEECHEALGGNLIDGLVSDLRLSLRGLRKSPGFTLVAVCTLALAIGANALVFAVMNAFLLRPLNVPQPDRLWAIERTASFVDPSQSYPDYIDLRDRNRSFDGLAGYTAGEAGLDAGSGASSVWAIESTGNYFDVLRLQPYLGRFFHASDEHGPNSAPYIVLGYAYWRSHFQDDPGVVGRVVELNKHPYTILGVGPPNFRGTLLVFSPDIYVPMVNQEQIEGVDELNKRGDHWVFMVMGHLKPGVTRPQAIADLNSIGAYLEKNYPKEDAHVNFLLARPSLYGDYLGRPMRAFFTGLTLLAGLILLAACANLGSLFAARAADRSREVALRLALGSTRTRILRSLFTEAVLISLIGGALGLWGSVLLLRGLSTWNPIPRYPMHVALNPDAKVYGVALLLALASGFLFGAVPVRQVLHTNPYEVVKLGSTGPVGRRITARDVLLVAQITICAVLVTASMVAVRGLLHVMHSSFGFEPQNAMLLDTQLTMAGYKGDRVPIIQKRMIEAMETIPGVRYVGLADVLPLHDSWNPSNVFTDKTTDMRPANAAAEAIQYNISPDYFRAAGTALLAGRSFTWHDDSHSPRVVVINQEFARRILGSVPNAMGKYFKLPDGTRLQVVGIAEDGKYTSPFETPHPAMFLPILQSPSNQVFLVVRSNGDPQQLAAAMKRTLHQLDPGLPFYIQTWATKLESAFFGFRMATMSLGVLGVMGAMLAITGIFGMAAYAVSKRTKELGIRIALGARREEVLQAALGRAFKLLAIGSAAGLLLGILASRVLAFIVYLGTPGDPAVLGGAVLTMLLLGLLATWIPAQRALKIDPLLLLREE
jgi:predicted permease